MLSGVCPTKQPVRTQVHTPVAIGTWQPLVWGNVRVTGHCQYGDEYVLMAGIRVCLMTSQMMS